MMKKYGLHGALAFVLAMLVGCAQASGENKDRAKSGDNKAASNDQGGPIVYKSQQPKMATREGDWRNVPKEEGQRPVANYQAQVYEATLKAVDADRSAVTVEVKGRDYTLRVRTDAFIEEPSNRSYALQGGLSALGAGNHVLITTVKENDQDVVSRIKLLGRGE